MILSGKDSEFFVLLPLLIFEIKTIEI